MRRGIRQRSGVQATWLCLPMMLILAGLASPLTAQCDPPEAPCGVVVAEDPPDTFDITWQDSLGEVSYRVERKKGCCRGFITVA